MPNQCPAGEVAFACDAKNKIIGGGVRDNRFYAFDPGKPEWLSQEIQGGKPGSMIYHCLVYSPVDNVYVFIAGGKTWAYRWKRRTLAKSWVGRAATRSEPLASVLRTIYCKKSLRAGSAVRL